VGGWGEGKKRYVEKQDLGARTKPRNKKKVSPLHWTLSSAKIGEATVEAKKKQWGKKRTELRTNPEKERGGVLGNPKKRSGGGREGGVSVGRGPSKVQEGNI